MAGSRVAHYLIGAIAVGMSLFHIYTGATGSMEAFLQRIIHLGFGLSLLFLLPLANRRESDEVIREYKKSWLEGKIASLIFIVLFLTSLIYLLFNFDYIAHQRFPYVTPLTSVELIMGLGLIAAVLEATRRTMGWGMTILALLFFVYPIAGPYLPGIFHHQGYSLGKFVDNLVFTTDGIFGIPLGISSTFLILFVIFAAFLDAVGFSQFLLNFASGVAGRLRGGPAKIAVLTSALTGMVSGSAVANVVTTGTFSIPLMKKVGYKREYAGAVEAAASTGAQFLPPIMGAQAFIMAQFTGIPYIEIAIYSTIPAILYFLGIWINLDMESRRLGLRGLTRDEVGDWKSEVISRWHLVIPFILLVYLLAAGRTPVYAVIYSLFALLIISFFRRSTRVGWKPLLMALEKGAMMSLTVIAASAVSGIIIGAVTITGLGERFTGLVLDLSGGSLFLALVLAMIASLILGMGLPTIPAYIIQISILVPTLIEMGLPPVVAHLFAIYFSCISMITPPVAIAAFAAAAISGGSALRIGIIATKIGAVAFIVPFMFAYNPALLLMGGIGDIIWSVGKAIVCVFAVALALQGFLVRELSLAERMLSVTAVICIAANFGPIIDVAGIAITLMVIVWQMRGRHQATNSTSI